VILSQESNIEKLLNYYMGKNTPERQEFIIDNLVVEKDDEPEIVKTVLDEAELPA
jgi:topoisomerase-4 subunit B